MHYSILNELNFVLFFSPSLSSSLRITLLLEDSPLLNEILHVLGKAFSSMVRQVSTEPGWRVERLPWLHAELIPFRLMVCVCVSVKSGIRTRVIAADEWTACHHPVPFVCSPAAVLGAVQTSVEIEPPQSQIRRWRVWVAQVDSGKSHAADVRSGHCRWQCMVIAWDRDL